jgi:WD40 repeat protein
MSDDGGIKARIRAAVEADSGRDLGDGLDPALYHTRRQQILARRALAGKWLPEGRGARYCAVRRHLSWTTAQVGRNGAGAAAAAPGSPSSPSQCAASASAPGTPTLDAAATLASTSSRSSSASLSATSSQQQAPRDRAVSSGLHEAYAFGGIHQIFAEARGAIACLRFANNDPGMLCWGSGDGALAVVTAAHEPNPAVGFWLEGHTAEVFDFAFSLSNDYIVSVAADKTVRLWSTAERYLFFFCFFLFFCFFWFLFWFFRFFFFLLISQNININLYI